MEGIDHRVFSALGTRAGEEVASELDSEGQSVKRMSNVIGLELGSTFNSHPVVPTSTSTPIIRNEQVRRLSNRMLFLPFLALPTLSRYVMGSIKILLPSLPHALLLNEWPGIGHSGARIHVS